MPVYHKIPPARNGGAPNPRRGNKLPRRVRPGTVHLAPPRSAADELDSLDCAREEALLKRRARTRHDMGLAFVVCLAVLAVALVQILRITAERGAANDEYDRIASIASGAAPQTVNTASSPAARTPQSAGSAQDAPAMLNLADVVALNSECVGWIEMPDTPVSYPVVRAGDNEKYLNNTFLGSQNSAGAIFMDWRNAPDFSARHTLIYGHNLQNGSMFGSLHMFAEESYRARHPYVYLHTPGGVCHRYTVFACRVTNMYDAGYQVDFAGDEDLLAFAKSYGAPDTMSRPRMLTLSTCTNNAQEERLVLHAYYDGTQERDAPQAGQSA